MSRYSSAGNFDNYRTIEARYNNTATCGHEVKKGEYIGWNRRTKETQCPDCWRRWQSENAEAQAYEDSCPW